MQQTISEELLFLPNYFIGWFRLENNLLYTLNVSCILLSKLTYRDFIELGTVNVKKFNKWDNSQVTKAFNSWVGTSEAIRLLNINKKCLCIKSNQSLYHHILRHYASTTFSEDVVKEGEKIHKQGSNWNEWLAGLIDGDGSFLLSKKGYASLEITMDIRDEHALQIIKNVYGGSIKLRSGTKALRYRLHHKSGLLNLINDTNGHIRNSNRLVQLNKICNKYNIILKLPEKLTYNNGWLSGFFDADGTVTLNSNTFQLSVSVSQKTSELLLPLVDLYGGYIYIDNSSSKSFKWSITKREIIINLLEYFKKHPSRSEKKNRLHLIHKYYELKDIKAHKAVKNTYLAKSLDIFLTKWLTFKES